MWRSGRPWLWGIAVLVLLVGCSHNAPTAGTISGVVRVYGGPATVVDGKVTMALNGVPAVGQTVTVTRDGKRVATTSTDKTGAFSLSLRPGNYTVAACVPGPSPNATVRASSTTTVDLSCDVP